MDPGGEVDSQGWIQELLKTDRGGCSLMVGEGNL